MTERSEHAQRLLDDPVLNDAFKGVLDEMIASWIRSPVDAVAQRESYYLIAVAVDRVRGKLRSFVDDAKFEAARANRA